MGKTHKQMGLILRTLKIILVLVLFGICALIWGGLEKWNILISVATLLGVIIAVFLHKIRTFLHCPEFAVYAGRDLIDSRNNPHWVRGKIINIGKQRRLAFIAKVSGT